MVQKRPFSGNTRDLSADPDRSRALERVYASPWLPCWSFSSARTACTPEVPASERAAHPSATPRDSCRPDWGLHCGGTGGGLGRTEARGMVQKRVTAQGWLGSTPEGQRPQIRGLRARGLAGCCQLDPSQPTIVTCEVGREGRHAPRPNDVGGQPRFPGARKGVTGSDPKESVPWSGVSLLPHAR